VLAAIWYVEPAVLYREGVDPADLQSRRTWTVVTPVMARFEDVRGHRVQLSDGVELESQLIAFLPPDTQVKDLDGIKRASGDWRIILANPVPNRMGEIDHWECHLDTLREGLPGTL
jgi:hypothetical protein